MGKLRLPKRALVWAKPCENVKGSFGIKPLSDLVFVRIEDESKTQEQI